MSRVVFLWKEMRHDGLKIEFSRENLELFNPQ